MVFCYVRILRIALPCARVCACASKSAAQAYIKNKNASGVRIFPSSDKSGGVLDDVYPDTRRIVGAPS
jgi:hypothetical protein